MNCEVESCGRIVMARRLCPMHYARLRRNGGPLVKRRARGVMDAPIAGGRPPRPKRTGLVLGHTQVRILRELAKGEIVSYERLTQAIGGQSQNALQQVVSSLRLRFGWDVIETHIGKGYSAGPTLERLLR